MKNMGNLGNPVRNTAASEIQSMVSTLTEQVEQLSVLAAERLAPISLSEAATAGSTPEPPQTVMPPYFDELRVKIQKIKAQLYCIDATIRRTEI